MSKLIVIGIDGFDYRQLDLFEDHMPNFKKLKNVNRDIKLSSIFPPDSIPAWGSIYTGLNPAEHGSVNFIDPNDKNFKINFKDVHKSYRGKTFWDNASDKGKKVCILLPFSIYPPWPVNGIMVCRTLEIEDDNFPLKTYPEDIYDKFKLSDFNINLFHGFPSNRNLDKYIYSLKKRTENEAELGLRFLRNYDADLYFIYFSALDAIQHTFWNYYDENHPNYPGDSPYKTIIKDFYIHFDRIIGYYIDTMDNNDILIIMSDHGHGMRPINLVNINEILRTKRFLCPTKKNQIIKKEKIKKLISDMISIIGLGNLTLKILNRFTIWKEILAQPSYIDFDKTIAYVSNLSGIKSYSQGGIIINKTIKNIDYDDVRCKIIEELRYITVPNGRRLVKWITEREELYSGKFIDRYPDILFELEDGYGVGWSIYDSIIGTSSMSSFQPGSHSKDYPIFLISINKGIKTNMTLMDIAPIILNILDNENNF